MHASVSKKTPAYDGPDVRQASGFEEVVEVVDLERWSIIREVFFGCRGVEQAICVGEGEAGKVEVHLGPTTVLIFQPFRVQLGLWPTMQRIGCSNDRLE